MFDRIVVGYGSDRAGRDALTLAGKLAGPLHGRVTVVFPYNPLLARVSADVVEERVRGEAQALLCPVLEEALITYHWTPTPWPIHGLHELAEYESADLLLFGSAREGVSDRLHISLMERMVHGAPCAVAVAPSGYGEINAPALHRIGVGFADSDEGRAALRLAHQLATLLDGELEVIAGSSLSPALAHYSFSSRALPDIEQEMYQSTEATLERVAGALGGPVPVRLQTLRGDPSRVLLERCRDLDLLVLGSRAYGPLRHALLGSVSAEVMREARCPVLVIPRGSSGRA